MEFLKRVYEERKKYFENLDFYLEKIKKITEKCNPEIFLFGSAAEGKYSVGLSDIDVAIVSDEFKDRDKKLELFGSLIKEFSDSPFEFHVLSKEQWEFYKRFIKKRIEIG